MELIALGLDHERALASFVAEFAASGEDRIPAFLPDPEWSFEETVAGFAKQSRGEELPEGWVPGTTRFLVDEGRIFGVFNLRHRLTDFLHRFGGMSATASDFLNGGKDMGQSFSKPPRAWRKT